MSSMSVPGILRLPEEVFYRYLFPYLKLNDLLRLRRMCKQTKTFSDDYIRKHYHRLSIEIDENDKTFGDFNLLGFKPSTVYVDNGRPEIFNDPCLPQFLEFSCEKITSLIINVFSTCISESESNFFSKLTNLTHLEIDLIDASEWKGETQRKSYFPPTFRNLKSLKLNHIEGPSKGDMNYFGDILKFCQKLEFLRLPLTTETDFVKGTGDPFGAVMEYLRKRKVETNLKYLDLQHFTFPESTQAILGSVCYMRGVRLLNFDVEHHQKMKPINPSAFPKFLLTVASFKNFWGYMLEMEMPNLEELIIISTAECTWARLWRDKDELPNWPNLKMLDVTIDSEFLQKTPMIAKKSTSVLIDFLFAACVRHGLVDLRIRFAIGTESDNELPCPRARAIFKNCPNVTMLTLTNWLGSNKDLSFLWTGLPNLKDVAFEDCKMLSDGAFVGENAKKPTFLKLKNLQKLTLMGLDLMSKITDSVFTLVFCNLSIKQFYLESQTPSKRVTIDGIRALLTGKFNKSVTKFPFTGWSLENVSKEQFLQLKKEFRASHMM